MGIQDLGTCENMWDAFIHYFVESFSKNYWEKFNPKEKDPAKQYLTIFQRTTENYLKDLPFACAGSWSSEYEIEIKSDLTTMKYKEHAYA